MTTALAKLSDITGASSEEISEVIKGMIISSKNQHGATASNAEMAVVTGTCARYGLNPLTKEAHAFISGGKLQMIIGIDGWTKIMLRQTDFDGVEFDYEWDGKNLIAVTTKIYSKERSRPTCVTEWMSECKQPKSDAWTKYPNRMLRNKSLGQCIRIAFGISEVIDDDEASRIDKKPMEARDITPQPSVDLKAIDLEMSEAGDLDTLKSLCSELREKMQTNGTWDTYKSDVIALNVKHKGRISSYDEVVEKNTSEEKTVLHGDIEEAEFTETPTTTEEEPDISFGDDDEDEFGEDK